MNTEFLYKGYKVRLQKEENFDPNSVDNLNAYSKIHAVSAIIDGEYRSTTSIGITVYKDEGKISDAIICGIGGATDVYHDNYIVEDNALILCVCSTVYKLEFPTLEILWSRECDSVTCFSIHAFKDDFIVHGETQITRLGKDGSIRWEFSARDIFVVPDNNNPFKIDNDKITVRDWQGYTYFLNEFGQLLKEKN